jgi:hypothetical protein
MPALLTSTSSLPTRDRRVDQPLRAGEVADVVAVGDRLAARLGDLLNNLLGRTERGRPAAVARAAEIVHHDLGAMRRQHQRMLAPNPAPRPGNDADPSLTEFRHFALRK